MSDNADLAADNHEIQINALISQRSVEPQLPIIGKCHNCKEPCRKVNAFVMPIAVMILKSANGTGESYEESVK